MLDDTARAGSAPKTDSWSALESEQEPSAVKLLVSGLVEVPSAEAEPILTEADSSGPALQLDLTIESSIGPQVLIWKQVTYSQEVHGGKFREIEILWDGEVIASCEVRSDDSAHVRSTLQAPATGAKATIRNAGGRARQTAEAALDTVGEAVATPAGKMAAGAVAAGAVAAVGVAVATAVSRRKKATKGKTSTKKAAKAKAKTKAKAKVKSKAKAKSKSKARSAAKAKSTTAKSKTAKSKAKSKSKVNAVKKTKAKKAAAKKSAAKKSASKKSASKKKAKKRGRKRG